MLSMKIGVTQYIKMRRTMGYQQNGEERLLNSLADYHQSYKIKHLTLETMNQWFSLHSTSEIGGYYYYRCLGVVRLFSEYWHHYDPKSEMISRAIKAPRYQRPEPHIYSKKEYQLFLNECENLYSPMGLRKHTMFALFGLIMCCGLRRSEPINLDQNDVDLINGIINIKNTKFKKSRSIPLSASTLVALNNYNRIKNKIIQKKSPYFFVNEENNKLSTDSVGLAFRRVAQKCGIKKNDSSGPTIRDMRHTFAVNTIASWLREGANLDQKMPLLSTYLGHKKPSETYHYLSSTLEVLDAASKRRNCGS